MSGALLNFVVPGSLDQRTGGYLYDARMVSELRARDRDVVVHELPGAFPEGDQVARSSLDGALSALEDGAVAVVDGLAGGGLPEALERHAARLSLVGLVHHPLADETGLSREEVSRFRASEERALGACRGVVVTSRFTAERLSSFGVPAERVSVAVPGTEPADPATGPGEGEPPSLLCVASLTRRKGHDVLVDALAVVSDLAWSCVFAGSAAYDPDHAADLRERVGSRGIEDRVSFVGELDSESLSSLYHRSTLFVLASHYEGYGMALTEAISRGLPVVSTTGGAIPFTVPAQAGILVPPGDVERFADALRRVLTTPGELATLRAAATRAAAELPDWSRASLAFEAGIDRLSAMPAPLAAGQSS